MNERNKLSNHGKRTSTLYDRLCAAVIEQAVKDYYTALKHLKLVPNDARAKWTVDECELFFRKDMEIYSDMDGEWIIKEVRKRAKEEGGGIDLFSNCDFDD